MRPRRLAMENFGPYRERVEIDFSRLGEVFLVWGRTGAGKTTIFDAMCYALYGVAPGSRAGLERQLRSHYARPGEAPLVEFEFEIGGEAWSVTRYPPWRRASRRGGETEVPQRAELRRLEAGEWRSLAAKPSEVDAEIRSRLGLSAQEFSKIILLPQGEFQRFLEMDSTERVAILEKLFPVDLHHRVTELARARCKSESAELARLDAELARLAAELPGPAGAEADAGSVSPPAAAPRDLAAAELARQAALEAERAAARDLAMAAYSAALGALRAGEEKAERAAALDRAKARLAAVEAGSPRRATLAASIDAARRAREVAPLLIESRRSAEALAEAGEELARRAEALAAVEALREEIGAEGARGAAMALELQAIEREKGGLVPALAAWRGFAEAGAAAAAARAGRAEAEAGEAEARAGREALAEALAAVAVGTEEAEAAETGFAAANAAFEAAKEGLVRAEAGAEALASAARLAAEAASLAREAEAAESAAGEASRREAEALALRAAALAAGLAAGLEPGKPCPVCGSLDHPAPALSRDAGEVGADPAPFRAAREEALARAASVRASLAAKEARRAEFLERAAALGAAPGEEPGATPGVEEARLARDAAAAAVATHAASRRELEERRRREGRLRAELDRASARVEAALVAKSAADAALAGAEEALRSAAEGSGGEDPSPRLQALEKRGAALAAALAAIEARARDWSAARERAASAAAVAEGRLPGLAAAATAAAADLRLALAAAGFADEAGAEAAALPAAGLAALEAEAAAFDRELAAAGAAAEEAGAALGPGPRPDLAALGAGLEARKADYEAALAAHDSARALRERAGRLLGELERLGRERGELSLRAGRLTGLSALLSGELPGRRLPFKNWVLGRWFREVVERAGARLSEMSDGRYSLAADEGSQGGRGRIGLELLVRDAHTGRERPAGTLSGGERFLASLSLALGLADAIRGRSGGVELDAVFIDEGFGSLDEEALDRAISALDRARGARTVGIVSHVAELRQRIPSRIEVSKGKGGSSLAIVG